MSVQCLAVVGMQWGDEGKGKIIDYYARDFDCIVRYCGGDNAGHTVKVAGETFKLHLIPSGVLYPEKVKVIGNGVVLNPQVLFEEIDALEKRGRRVKNLIISDRAHILMPYHQMLDGARESERRDASIGTTRRGIGPAYEDKAGRTEALRAIDFIDEDNLRNRVQRIFESKKSLLNTAGLEISASEELAEKYVGYGRRLKPYVANTAYFLNKALDEGRRVLLEGAQGTLLDIDHGTYPYVTSSNPTIGGACTGTGIPPQRIDQVVGVAKAYTTRVGRGPFPTELGREAEMQHESRDDRLTEEDVDKANAGEAYCQGKVLRKRGSEYGTTTGRPRRCGWLDTVALRYAAMINGVNGIALTKLDVLSGLREIRMCVAYEIDGNQRVEFPTSLEELEKANPIYKTFHGWEDIAAQEWEAIAKKARSLPSNAQVYLDAIAKEIERPIYVASVGPERQATIIIHDIFSTKLSRPEGQRHEEV